MSDGVPFPWCCLGTCRYIECSFSAFQELVSEAAGLCCSSLNCMGPGQGHNRAGARRWAIDSVHGGSTQGRPTGNLLKAPQGSRVACSAGRPALRMWSATSGSGAPPEAAATRAATSTRATPTEAASSATCPRTSRCSSGSAALSTPPSPQGSSQVCTSFSCQSPTAMCPGRKPPLCRSIMPF